MTSIYVIRRINYLWKYYLRKTGKYFLIPINVIFFVHLIHKKLFAGKEEKKTSQSSSICDAKQIEQK